MAVNNSISITSSDVNRARSNLVFFILVLITAILSGLSVYLPQGDSVPVAAQTQSTIPTWQLALASAAIVLVIYGGLGALGRLLARKISLPDLFSDQVTDRQRFVIPAIIGALIGFFLVSADIIFANFNGIGRLVHPPFPTSVVASITAGINEEILFRLFFVSLWVFLIARVLFRGRLSRRGESILYGIVSVVSALAFAAGHFPAVMYLTGATSIDALPAGLIAEIFLLNGVLALAAAYLLKRSGFLAAAGVHMWADIVWHVFWGLIG